MSFQPFTTCVGGTTKGPHAEERLFDRPAHATVDGPGKGPWPWPGDLLTTAQPSSSPRRAYRRNPRSWVSALRRFCELEVRR